MKDARFGEEVVGDLRYPRPRCPIGLAAPLKRAPPEVEDAVAEGRDGPAVGRNRVVCEEAADDLPQPLPLFGDGSMHPPPQLLLDLLELSPNAVAPALPPEEEAAFARSAADEGEAEKVEGLRFAEPALLAIVRRVAAKLDQTGLVRMER